MRTPVGDVVLGSPVMTASGTAGHGAELAAYGKLGELGAVVVKSLHPKRWPGNPEPRLAPLRAGMINSVGLQGPGIEHWLNHDLPRLVAAGATVVASIWGTSVDEYRLGAEMLAEAGPEVVAVEVNLSCPNTEAGRRMFAASPAHTRAVMEATAGCGRPRWAKLSPACGDIVEVAEAAADGGAGALVLVNTMPGMLIHTTDLTPALGAGGGGVSGAALHPVAVRAVFDVYTAMPEVPIVGVGGVARGADAAELLLAGACAVQVGTATFADPRAPWRVQRELRRWMGARSLTDVIGAATSHPKSPTAGPVASSP